MNVSQKSIRIVGGILVIYALLVATHLGEFWPFSIYPMFSQAGNPWSRSLVREMPSDVADARKVSWTTTSLDSLAGDSYPLVPQGINQNDVANYVSKTESWTPDRIQGLRSIFAKNRSLPSPLLVYRVRGRLADDSVSVRATPVLLLTNEGSHLNPSLAPPSPASASSAR